MLLRLYQKLRGRDYSDPCLYIFPFSLPSIMVQFTIALALRNKSQSSQNLAKIKHRLVNLHRNENLGEDYLLHVNPRGKVWSQNIYPVTQVDQARVKVTT